MVRELHISWAEDPSPSWDRLTGLYYELAVEGVPLPEDFRELLDEQYQHLVAGDPARPPENVRAWAAYLSWAGDIVEDPRTPRERLEAYFLEQEAKLDDPNRNPFNR